MRVKEKLKNLFDGTRASRRGLGISDLPTTAIFFVVAALVIGFGTDILADINTGFAQGTGADQVLENWTTGMINLSANAGSLGQIVIAAVIISVVAGAFLVGAGKPSL